MFCAEGWNFPGRITARGTYVNEVPGMEHIRDLIAKQILFSPSKTLDVDMLDNHLYTKVLV